MYRHWFLFSNFPFSKCLDLILSFKSLILEFSSLYIPVSRVVALRYLFLKLQEKFKIFSFKYQRLNFLTFPGCSVDTQNSDDLISELKHTPQVS